MGDQITHDFDPTTCRHAAEAEAKHLKDKSQLFREKDSTAQNRAVLKKPEYRPDFGEQRFMRLKEQFAKPKEA